MEFKSRYLAYRKHPVSGWIVYGLSHKMESGPKENIPLGKPILVAGAKGIPDGHVAWREIETVAVIQHGKEAYGNPIINQLAYVFGKPYPVRHGLVELAESDRYLEDNLSKDLLAIDAYGLFFEEDIQFWDSESEKSRNVIQQENNS